MKSYKITSKMYVSTPVPISDTKSIVIPKKGTSITVQAKELPYGLKVLKDKNLIIVEEIN